MEVREREEKLASLVGPDVPVTLNIRVIGQWVVRGRKFSRSSCHQTSTTLGKEIKSDGEAGVYAEKDVPKLAHSRI